MCEKHFACGAFPGTIAFGAVGKNQSLHSKGTQVKRYQRHKKKQRQEQFYNMLSMFHPPPKT